MEQDGALAWVSCRIARRSFRSCLTDDCKKQILIRWVIKKQVGPDSSPKWLYYLNVDWVMIRVEFKRYAIRGIHQHLKTELSLISKNKLNIGLNLKKELSAGCGI